MVSVGDYQRPRLPSVQELAQRGSERIALGFDDLCSVGSIRNQATDETARPRTQPSQRRFHDRVLDTLADEGPVAPTRNGQVLPELAKDPVDKEEWRGRLQSRGSPVARPRPTPRTRANAGPDRVQNDIASKLEQVGLTLDENRRVTALKHVTDAPMPAVEALRMVAPHLLHPASQVGPRSLDEEVVVIAHQTVGMHAPGEALTDRRENGEEPLTIPGIQEDRLARVPAGDDVVQRTWKLDSKRPHHTTKPRHRPPSIQRSGEIGYTYTPELLRCKI
ncbi:MAG: hypothetical protein U0R69_15450 [Gaiellales bacterium]